MNSAPEDLEQRLRRALDQRARELPVGRPDWTGPRTAADRLVGRRRFSWIPAGAVSTALSATVAIAVIAGALLVAGHRSPSAGSVVPGTARSLVSELAIFRRPQTAADRSQRHYLAGPRPFSQLRRMVVGAGGVKLFLDIIPRATPGSSQGDVLAQYVEFPGGGGGGGQGDVTAQTLHRPSSPQSITDLRNLRRFPGIQTRFYYEVVPDGVARVRWSFGRRDSNYNSPLYYPRSLTVTVAVHDNVASMLLTDRGQASAEAWYTQDGLKFASTGNTDKLNQVPNTPHPGPQTTLSRRAEHDPSTPDPLHLTPGARTAESSSAPTYELSFMVLINHGVYQLAAVRQSPKGRGCGGPNGVLSLYGGDDVRGQTFKIPLYTHDWCPGTYRISVAYVGQTPRRTAYSPFGTTTLTLP